MRLPPLTWVVSALFTVGCGSATPAPRQQARAPERSALAAPSATAPPPAPVVASAVPAPPIAPLPPPPVVTTPMPGSPESAALSQVRLVGASCANLQAAAARQAQARIQQMNREVDAEFRDWRAAQSQCWCDAHPERCYGPGILDE